MKDKKENGFTILETLVAIFILLISITGPMVFAQTGLRAAFQARDQITAFYLAQDVIEVVKNHRDNQALTRGSHWLGGFKDCLDGCTVDTVSAEIDIDVCPSSIARGCLGPNSDGSQDSKLKFNQVSGDTFIGTGSDGPDTIFSRTVYVDEIELDREARVTVKIRWRSHANLSVKEITVVENILNWPAALGL